MVLEYGFATEVDSDVAQRIYDEYTSEMVDPYMLVNNDEDRVFLFIGDIVSLLWFKAYSCFVRQWDEDYEELPWQLDEAVDLSESCEGYLSFVEDDINYLLQDLMI